MRIFSGVAGIIVAISCCAAVAKLGSGCTSYPFYKLSIEDTLVELMDLSYSLVSVDKLHQLATEAGFEHDFLSHFGTNVLSGKKNDELEFWIGLAQKKLSLSFQKETVIPGKQAFHKKVCFMILQNRLLLCTIFSRNFPFLLFNPQFQNDFISCDAMVELGSCYTSYPFSFGSCQLRTHW